MNEKMLGLYNCAVNEASEEMRVWHTQWNHKPPLFDYEKCLYGKFAELLIQETLDTLYKTLDDSRDVQVFEGLRLAQHVIRDHFGVE